MQTTVDIEPFSLRSERASHRHALPPILLGLLAPMLLFLSDRPARRHQRQRDRPCLFVRDFRYRERRVSDQCVRNRRNDSSVSSTVNRRPLSLNAPVCSPNRLWKFRLRISRRCGMETYYDDDGYKTAVPVLVLTTRELVHLPTAPPRPTSRPCARSCGQLEVRAGQHRLSAQCPGQLSLAWPFPGEGHAM